jgi:hypothetical protein
MRRNREDVVHWLSFIATVAFISIDRFAGAVVSAVNTWGAANWQPALHSARSRTGTHSRKKAVSYGKIQGEPTSWIKQSRI